MQIFPVPFVTVCVLFLALLKGVNFEMTVQELRFMFSENVSFSHKEKGSK